MDNLDDQIVHMYEKVAIPFLHVAAERQEKLSQETLMKIVVKFIMIAKTMREDAVEGHLHYELDKYLREGLRPDYR